MSCRFLRVAAAVTFALTHLLCHAQGQIDAAELSQLLLAARPGDTTLKISPDGKHVAELGFSAGLGFVIMTDLQTRMQWQLRRWSGR